jgi:CCR4-NOT transcriptional regulation complex NOT5 subunit
MLGPEDDWRDARGGWTIVVHMIHTQHLEGRFDMKPTRTRLAGVAAVMATIAIAAPVSTAGAATTTTPVPRLTGPTYITTAPTTFVNNNNQVSAADTSLGSQVAS